MVKSYKTALSMAGRKLSAIFLTAVMVLSGVPATTVFALNGTASYKPAESNIAEKYWVSASASSNSGDAVNALNEKTSAAWLADESDSENWFMIDLGGAYDAVRKTEVTFTNPAYVYKYCLEGSADGDEWIILADRTDNDRRAAGFTDLFKFTGLRYLKLKFVSDNFVGIKNFKIINYLRDDMDNGSDTSGFTTNTTYYNANNNPPAPDGIRGGVMNEASMENGNNFFGLTKDMGWDTIRLRIWNEPKSESNGNPSTSCSPANTRLVAKYIKGAGQNLAIDFHYSDSWSDPQNQPKPYAWANLPFESTDPDENDLVKQTYSFTYDMIKSLIDQGTPPSIIALGNEISNGMMWGSEYDLTNPYRHFHHYYNTYIRDNLNAPLGGGVEWINYENAHGDKDSPEYKSFLASIVRLAKLVDAGQRAIQKLNDEYDLGIQTEMHFAFNVFEQPSTGKVANDPDEVYEKVVTLVGGLADNLNEMSGMTDRIGISYYPDWHGTYGIVQRNIVELSKMLPGVKFNIAECSPSVSGTINSSGIGWMSNPNVVQNPMNNYDPSLPTSFTYSTQWQGDDTINIMKTINDVPNNVGMGVWPWNGQSVYFTGGQPRASFLAFSQAFATNAVESGIYVTTKTGTAPSLPETVKNIDAKTGVITDVPVIWNDVDASDYANPGTFFVSGTAQTDGNMKDVKANITVTDFVKYSVQFTKDAAGISTAVFTVDNEVGDSDISAVGIIAAYNEEGSLADIINASVNAEIGVLASEQLQLGKMPNGYKLKAYLWDAVTYTPLCPVEYPVDEMLSWPVIEDPSNVDPGYKYARYFNPISVETVPEMEGRKDDFIRGADLSSLWVVVKCGAQFTDMNGQKLIEGDEISNALAIMKKYGLTWVRLRVWNDITPFPAGMQDNQGQGGQNNVANTLEIAKRAHALGLKVLLDFHYSDTWADPGRQIKPRAWGNIATMDELEANLYNFTKDSLQAFVDEGCMPEMVQIGNEVNSGLMYHEMTPAGTGWRTVTSGMPTGSASLNGGAGYVTLTKAGIRAVRDIDPNNANPEKRTKIMIHLANGNNTNMYRTRATLLKNNDVDYDVMGASYYPFWHGSIADLSNTMNMIANDYGKEVAVAETGWGFDTTIPSSLRPYTTGPSLSTQFGASQAATHPEFAPTTQGQADALRAISQAVAKVPDNKGLGVFVWEPAWIPTPQMGSGWAAGNSGIVVANQAHFDYYGRALPSCNIWPRLFPDS